MIVDDLSEEEAYLYAILSDMSGVDIAEFVLTYEENDPYNGDGSYTFRAWDVQWFWWRDMSPKTLEQGSRSVGKSMGIMVRALAFPFVHPGNEMVITAPEGVHLDAITDKIETFYLNNRLTREMLVHGRGGIKHRPFVMSFQNGARIMGRIPQQSGVGVKGIHPIWLELDEGQDYPYNGYIELIETLKRNAHGATWRIHGVTRGMGGHFYKFSQPGSGFKIHHLPAMFRPNWTDQERNEKIEEYGGSRENPDFRRNVYGMHGDATSPIFVLARLMENVEQELDPVRNDYNAIEYFKREIDEGSVREFDYDMDFLLDLPPIHTERYSSFWIGADIGYVNDPTAISVFAEYKPNKSQKSKLKLLSRIVLYRVANPQQVDVIIKLIKFYRPHCFAMDSTGNGLPLFQDIQWRAEHDEDLQSVIDKIKGYNFSSNIVVDFDERVETQEFDPRAIEKTEIRRNVKNYATDVLRSLVDEKRLILPYDRALITEWQGQSFSYNKAKFDSYGRTRSFSAGAFHNLDAARMAVLGWKQQAIEVFLKAQEDSYESTEPIFIY